MMMDEGLSDVESADLGQLSWFVFEGWGSAVEERYLPILLRQQVNQSRDEREPIKLNGSYVLPWDTGVGADGIHGVWLVGARNEIEADTAFRRFIEDAEVFDREPLGLTMDCSPVEAMTRRQAELAEAQ